METICICVYRDTIEEHDDDWNLTEVVVPKAFAEYYFENRIKTKEWNEWEIFEEFWGEYTADDTEDFYDYAMEHSAVMALEHW